MPAAGAPPAGRRRPSPAGLGLLGLGVALLLLNLAGWLLPPVPAGSGGPPGYLDRPRSVAESEVLIAELRAVPEPGLREAQRLAAVVGDHVVHDHHAVQPWDDWVLWSLGLLDADARDTIDAELIWRRGRGQCHQAAYVYAEQARALGFDPRLVWMNGHVIAQVEIPGAGWRAVDPDLGIFWPATVPELARALGVDGLASVLESSGFEPGWSRRMAEVYASLDDNVVSFVPHLPEKARRERLTGRLKWLLPALFLLAGAWLLRRRGA